MSPTEVLDLVVGGVSCACIGCATAAWKRDRDAARNWLLLSVALALVVIRWHAQYGPAVSVEVNR